MPCMSFDTLRGHKKRKKATQFEHFEGGYRSGYDGQKRKNEESFNHFKCITRYYIYTDIQWKGV